MQAGIAPVKITLKTTTSISNLQGLAAWADGFTPEPD